MPNDECEFWENALTSWTILIVYSVN